MVRNVHPTAVILGNCSIDPTAVIHAMAIIDGSDSPENGLVIRERVNVGVGAIVSGARMVGPGASIEAGAVVTRDVPAHAIVAGNPAIVVGYTVPHDTGDKGLGQQIIENPKLGEVIDLLGGAILRRLPTHEDLRGRLSVAEIGAGLPFTVRRSFLVYDVPSAATRGEHAHRTLHEFLICVRGLVRVSLTDGFSRREVVLDDPSLALYLPPGVWSTQYGHVPESVLLVLCSETYRPESYIRDFDEFLQFKGGQ